MLTDQLDHLAAMERAATPGKWESKGYFITLSNEETIGRCIFDRMYGTAEDGALASALRNAAPELIAVVRAASKASGLNVWCECDGRGCKICNFTHEIEQALAALAAALPVAGQGG